MSRLSRLRRKRRTSGPNIVLRVALVLGGVFLMLVLLGGAAAAATLSSWLQNLPDTSSPDAFAVAQPTRIYSADGKLLAKFFLQNRDVVSLDQMAPYLRKAIVAVEDERFYEHGGVDPVGIIRAVFTTAGGDRQGASTLTQQYVRNTVLINERTNMTLARKVREAYVAIELEKKLSKDQILADYLNTVYFGEGAYGAEAASRTYFAKSASELDLPQAALIAGIVQSPNRLDPYVNPAAAINRRRAVLGRMLYNKYITQDEYTAAANAPLVLKREVSPLEGIYSAPYYVSYVRNLLQDQFTSNAVFKGGLSVYTTLDTRMQAQAEKAAHRDYNGKHDPGVALVAIDPRTGFVKAMVGGTDYAKQKFNLATQGYRQPGSSFKTFVLVTALARGMSPNYSIDSHAPVSIPATPQVWVVNNSEGSGSGMISLESATVASVNAVYARLIYYGVGVKSVVRTARNMGITTPLPNLASIALGSVGCTPLEMASAYGTLANQGKHCTPVTIAKVVDRNGNVIFQAVPKPDQVVNKRVAYAATKILQGVLEYGTAAGNGIGRPAAGKTGTSQDNRDCWFVGYTPQLVTAVWVGYTPEKTIMKNGTHGFGGTVAAPIWARFMEAALAGQPKMDFPWVPSPPYNGHFDIPVSYETLHPPAPKVTKPTTKPGTTGKGTKTGGKTGTKKGGKTGGGKKGGGGSTTTSGTPSP